MQCECEGAGGGSAERGRGGGHTQLGQVTGSGDRLAGQLQLVVFCKVLTFELNLQKKILSFDIFVFIFCYLILVCAMQGSRKMGSVGTCSQPI